MTTRRDFLKTVAISSTLLVGSSLVGPNLLADAPAKITKDDLVKEDVGTAQGLKYCQNADKESKGKAPKCDTCVDKAKRCKTCNYFSTAGKLGTAEVGKCLLIQDQGAKYVYAAGCCAQWAQKQG